MTEEQADEIIFLLKQIIVAIQDFHGEVSRAM